MALTKIINDENRSYKPVLTDKLVLDNKPTVNSFNGITSDAVARAVAGASGEVPAVTSSDDGKVLTAIYDEGGAAVEWADAQAGLPDMTGQDGKVLGAVDVEGTVEAQWVNPPTELPSVSNNAGKVLTVKAGSTGVEWANVPTELPSVSGNANKVLTVNSWETGVEWASAQGYTAQMPVNINYSNQIQLNYTPDFKLSTVEYPNANLTMLDSNKAIQVVQQFGTEQNLFYELRSMPASAQGYPFFGSSSTSGCWFRIAWPAGQNGSNKISLSSSTPVGLLIYKKDDPTSYYQFYNEQVPVGSYGGFYALGVMKNPDGTIHSNWSSSTSDCYWEISAHLQEVYDQDMNYVSLSNFYNEVLNNSTNADKYAVCFRLLDGTGTQITLGSQSFATTMIQPNYLQITNPVPAFTSSDNGKVLGVVNGALAWVSLT